MKSSCREGCHGPARAAKLTMPIKELQRCAKMGLAGGMITVYPPEGKGYDNPMYEPLWAAAQDLDIPLGMHIATNRPGPGQDFGLEDRNRVRNSFLANADHWVRMSLGEMIFSGVFERYPKLQVGTVEHELSWIPHFLNRIDYTYTQRVQQERYRFKEAMLPSAYFHRNVFAGFQEDAMGIRDRNVMVSTISSGAPIIPMSNPPSPGAGKSLRRF
jgi:predicted TIM-barrel fold metal-dependent hydrolase